MKKVSVIIIAVVLLGVGAYLYYPIYQEGKDEDVASFPEETSAPVEEDSEQPEDDETLEPVISAIEGEDVEDLLPLDMEEFNLQERIHHMSHGYVHASQKWGKFQVTEERLERILVIIEANQYEHGDVYEQIITRWLTGDFSQAVEDHNKIWRLQNGNVGEATRLLTEKEIQSYHAEHFQE